MIEVIMKFIVVAGVISAVCVFAYFYLSNGKSSFEPKETELAQIDLQVQEIDIGVKNKIWKVNREINTVAFTIVFKNEGARNFRNTPGLLKLIEKSIFDGAAEYDANKLAEVIIDNNISLNISFGIDNAVVKCYTTSDKFEFALEIVGKILTKAHFKPQKIDLHKQEIIAELRQSKFESDTLAAECLSHVLYQKNHPYYFSIDETIKAVSGYSRFDIEQGYSKLFTANNAEITVVGNVSNDVVKKGFAILLQLLESSKRNNFAAVVQSTNVKLTHAPQHAYLDSPQTTVMFVMPAVASNSKDYFAYKMAELVLGDAASTFGNRLFGYVREVLGLCYGIWTQHKDNDLLTMTTCVARTSTENVEKLINAVQHTVEKFQKNGITSKELKEMKTMLSSHVACESALDTVVYLAGLRNRGVQAFELSKYMDNFYRLTVNDVNKAAKKFEILAIVTAGKARNDKALHDNVV